MKCPICNRTLKLHKHISSNVYIFICPYDGKEYTLVINRYMQAYNRTSYWKNLKEKIDKGLI